MTLPRLSALPLLFALGLLPLALWLSAPGAVLPGTQEAGKTAPFELTQEAVDRAVALALPVLREESGVEFEGGVRARLATAEELEAALFEENRALLLSQIEDEAQAEQGARRTAWILSRALLGKFVLESGEVWIVPENFDRTAKVLGQPEMVSEPVLRAVLLHELAHAADQRAHRFGDLLLGLGEPERVLAYQAVIEGHAQLVARRAAARLGWSEGFETFTRAISAVPPEPEGEDDPGRRFLLRVATATQATSYVQGERFMAAVEDELGADGVARAFRSPPADMAEVFEPSWYLHPERRPAERFDLGAALDAIEERLEPADWSDGPVRLTLTRDQLEASMQGLPPETIARILGTLRATRALVATTAGGQGQLVVGLSELPSPADAAFYAEANARLLHLKDELMKRGSIRILEAGYEPALEPLQGIAARKQVQAGERTMEVLVLSGHFGSLAIEIVAADAPLEPADLRELARVALEHAPIPEPVPAGAEKR